GIAAPRMDEGVAVIQSGVTSVNPLTSPNLKNIARRRMADFIQDSLARRLKRFSKKINTRERRAVVVGEVEGFCESLVSRKQKTAQRIDSFLLNAKDGNTADSIAAGMFRLIVKVRTLSSLGVIVLETEVGENVVTVREAA